MIREHEVYHGVALARLLSSLGDTVEISSHSSVTANGVYIVSRGDKRAGLYLKYSTNRLTPWRFSFTKEHQDEIRNLKNDLGEVFLVLVCGQDGIAALNYAELKLILDENHEPVEWVSASRRKREMYTIKGKDGSLGFKIGDSDFPKKVRTYLGINGPDGHIGLHYTEEIEFAPNVGEDVLALDKEQQIEAAPLCSEAVDYVNLRVGDRHNASTE